MPLTEKLNRRFTLLIPGYWACLFDEIITIVHQPREYWNGNLKAANEGNPIGAFLMTNHVSGIFVISAIWLVVIGLVTSFIPVRHLKTVALFVLIAHTYGASSWLSGHYGYWSAIGFILFNSVLFAQIDEWHTRLNGLNMNAQFRTNHQ